MNAAATAVLVSALLNAPPGEGERETQPGSPAAAVTSRPVTPTVRELSVPAVVRSRKASQPSVADTGRRATERFSMVGVTWAPGPAYSDVDVEVRVRTDRVWTDWQHLAGHGEGSGRAGTDPLWVGEADAVQARVVTTGAPPRGLRVALVDPGATPADMLTPVSAAMSTPARPAVVTRAAWGADESLRSTCEGGTYGDTVKVAFVHHTAGSNDYTSSESASIVRGIYAFHTQSRGWCDVGYNFLVDRFGTVFEGRRGGQDRPVLGAHTGGYNTNSTGVALMGNFETVEAPEAAMTALADVVAWKLASNYRDPQGTAVLAGKQLQVISGHRDAGSTACPGRHVYDQLPALRQRIRDLIPPYDSPVYAKWQQLGGERGFVGSPFRGEVSTGEVTNARFTGADIWWKSGIGAHEVHGPIRREYRRFSSRDGRLGVPTADERAGSRRGSRFATFEGGRIYWSGSTGARTLYGPIVRRYQRLGSIGSRLELPTTAIRKAGRPGSRYAKFQGGRIYWSRGTGARQTWGPIQRRYVRLGAERSRLRLPTTGPYGVRGGAVQRFQGGKVRWYRSTGKVAVTYR